MANEIPEGAPEGAPAGWQERLRNLGGSFARRWPRRLRPRLPRLKWWQWAIAGVVVLAVVLWLSATVQSTSTYSATVLVTEGSHGIAPPGNPFDFGDLPPTASMDNELTYKNEGKTHVFIMIGVFGGIRDFLDVEDAFFNLKPGEEREIVVTLSVPATAEPGKRYDGRVVITRLPYWVP